MLRLTAPEMTALVGGMRALDANYRASRHGVLTDRPETLDQRLLRQPARHGHRVDEVGLGREPLRGPRRGDRRGEVDRHRRSTSCSARNSELRALAEVYACDDAGEKFVRDFVAAWDKVMNLDRFDRS